MSTKTYRYPITAIVGQEKMKQALLLNVVNPKLGGVLIRGEKGTAKSTAVRALADLLTELKVVNLPVGATEDRVVGTLDIEHAIKHGEKKFEPGLLAKADGHILYVDEINLLEDHIVDVLLDAVAMGINTIEREGISYSHSSRFILIGTMNPEEGDLRPQLLDRFALSVEVSGERDARQRVEVIKRRLSYEKDPEAFCQSYGTDQLLLETQIRQARETLKHVQISDDMLSLAARLSIGLDMDSHRADIMMIKTAMTIAAVDGRTEACLEDMKQAAQLVLPHRLRQAPFAAREVSYDRIDLLIDEISVVK
ncbi:ATP-binding protein [Paenibacillus sepulcri]|uniref:AAA family ATPase n=1 Tax=Paenibacillus sepulcri TaxID=359917 RepID=A0ABS7C9M5_9BACL|nr:AAA family ATPase [Paenibacillus sepulcri]